MAAAVWADPAPWLAASGTRSTDATSGASYAPRTRRDYCAATEQPYDARDATGCYCPGDCGCNPGNTRPACCGCTGQH